MHKGVAHELVRTVGALHAAPPPHAAARRQARTKNEKRRRKREKEKEKRRENTQSCGGARTGEWRLGKSAADLMHTRQELLAHHALFDPSSCVMFECVKDTLSNGCFVDFVA